MLLSDKLLKIGLATDKKNWKSKSIQAEKMLDALIEAKNNGESQKRLINTTKLVVKQLNDAGLSFFNFDMFWGKLN